MRKLMCFAIGFTAACAIGIYLLSGWWYLFAGLFCLLCCGAALLFSKRSARIAALILLGCVVGFGWLQAYDSLYLSHARSVDGETMPVTITASDFGFIPSYGEAVDGTLSLNGRSYQVRCYLDGHYGIQPGDTVSGEFRLRYTSDGGISNPTYHQGKGILLLAYSQDEIQHTASGDMRWQDYPAHWRHKILSVIKQVFPEDTFAFAKALLLGDTTDLTYSQDRGFQVSGIRHIVAVSGLHVAILFSLLYLFVGRNRFLVPLLGIPLLAVFAAIAGFTPSIVRACIMQAIMSLSMLAQREYDPATALSAAVLCILVPSPLTVTAVGFQLSVGCMVGIFLFSEPLRQYLLSFGNLKAHSKGKSGKAKLIRWFTGSVSVTLSAMVFTTPLCAIYFGMVSLVGILANLLTLWIISFVFYGIMLSCVAAAVWLPLGRAIAGLVSWPVRYVQAVAGLLSDFPLAAVYTDSDYIVFWLIFTYVFLGVFFLLKRKYPGITAAGILTMLCVCLALSWLEPRLDGALVSVIDVGQGQSILLKQGSENYLVDCGGKHAGIVADTVSNYLLSQGIFRLDGVILTHYDADHAGSVVNLLSSVDADRIYMPDIYDTNGIRQTIENTHSEKIRLISGASEVNLENGKISFYPVEPGENDNDNSVCVLFQTENCDILITGDRSAAGERKLLAQTQLPKLELLVVGHHGSNSATSYELLAATQPDMAVISVGQDNHYGHPRQEVLDRLQLFGSRIYRTDLHGTVRFGR